MYIGMSSSQGLPLKNCLLHFLIKVITTGEILHVKVIGRTMKVIYFHDKQNKLTNSALKESFTKLLHKLLKKVTRHVKR